MQLAAGDAQRANQPGHGHAGRALDVVVEDADAVAVLLKQAEGVVVGEVLELDHGVGEALLDGGDEFVDQVVVLLARYPRLRQAEIQRVVQQFARCWCRRRG